MPLPTAHKPPRLIGLYSPRPGAGKTTAALRLHQIMTQRFGEAPKIRPFAQPIRDIASGFLEFGLGLSDAATRALYADKDIPVPGYDFTGRDLLGWLGTKVGREMINPDVWVHRTMRLIDADLSAGHSVIVDDVTWPNEYQALRCREAFLVRIDRGGHVTTDTDGLLDDREFDHHLNNDGTLLDLQMKLFAALNPPDRYLATFQFAEKHPIRLICFRHLWWFVGADACGALGIARTYGKHAWHNILANDEKFTLERTASADYSAITGFPSKAVVVTGAGLLKLMELAKNAEDAERFRVWVGDCVAPAIAKKHGSIA